MTDQAMSPLRLRMIEDMTIRKFAPKTQHDYLQRVKNFTIHLGRSPDTASSEDVLRTPAPGVCRATITGPASANLHNSRLMRRGKFRPIDQPVDAARLIRSIPLSESPRSSASQFLIAGSERSTPIL